MVFFKEAKFVDTVNRDIIIRSANGEDAKEVLNFNQEIINTEPYLLTTPDEFKLTIEQEQEWIENIQQKLNNLILIAMHKGEVVGTLDFHCGHKRRLEHIGSFGMSVRREYRGSGIGRALLHSLIEWALRNEKIEKINLEVFSNNHRAIELYKKIGFVEESLLKNQVKLNDNEYIDLIGMGLFLKTL
ncbi:GNAT family N-acetyltransferase [Paenibacillus sp. HJL G12]|uniref:GNAT family N-acetyltransferase n=1 Tax=Paenibacillus dendrobii TaxID=2691084 RepID=A0A7X3LG42_9BACL|nr:GNAT family N-acetyltransferase [Paenibacillus dendrobii]MWV44346.1 GNAT family N-acetyltransferase [Paenibacillus dendrobii]